MPPMANTTTTETYSEWLTRQMEAGGWTIRSLARAVKPENPEVARRSIRRYLNGQVPIERTRVELARVMKLPESSPKQSDDKEADLHARRPEYAVD